MLERASVHGDPSSRLRGQGIALIGGAGFIGHHLALHLAALGARVHVVDSLRVNNLGDLAARADLPNRFLYVTLLRQRLDRLARAGIPVHRIDARDARALGETMREIGCRIVVHLASIAHADRSDRDPYAAFQHSLGTLATVLDTVRGRADRLVYFSSSMVYGHFSAPEVDEEHPLNPIGIYGTLKLAGEALVRAHHRVFGLPFTIVRPSALYGHGCVSRRIVQVFVENAMRGAPLALDGDGSDRVDFTYVDDLVAGIVRVIASPAAANETFNLTCGNARSLLELAEIVRGAFPATRLVFKARDRLQPRRGTLSVARARALVGYAPQVQLEEGVARCVRELARCGLPPACWQDGPADAVPAGPLRPRRPSRDAPSPAATRAP